MKHNLFKPQSIGAILGLFGLAVMNSGVAEARLIFTTETDGVYSSGWTIDLDDESSNFIDLNFGSALGNKIQFDKALDKFIINNDVDFSGFQALDLRLENSAADPIACAAPDTGRMYFNTTDSSMYFCDGTAWQSSSAIAPGSITGAMIAANSISSSHIIDGTIVTADLADGSVTSSKIFDGSVNTIDLADGSVTTAKLGADSVDSSKIIDGSIANADLAADSVNSGNIVDGSIATADIANGAVDNTKLAADSVNSSNIVDGTIANADLAADSVNSGNIVDGSVTGADILDGTVANADLAADAVNSANIVDGSVTAADLAADAVTAASIADGSITSAKIADGTIANVDLAADSVNSANIVDGSVANADLAADSVNSGNIVDGSVTSTDIADGTIANADLAADSVNSGNIVDGSVATADVADSAINSAKITDDSIVFADIASREATEALSPEYPNFTVQADGTNNKGTLESDHDSTANKNFYKWSTRKSGAAHDYDIVFQWAIPENFQGFSTTLDEIQVDYKTDTTASADNKLDITLEDSTGAAVVLTGATDLVSSTADTWVEDHGITFTGGTFTPGDYLTVRIKFTSQATGPGNTNPAYIGAMKFNYLAK